MKWLRNIYIFTHLKRKLKFFTTRQKYRVYIKSKIYAFEISKELSRKINEAEIENDIFFIHSRIEKFLIERNLNSVLDIDQDYNNIIYDCLFDKRATIDEKEELLNIIDSILTNDINSENDFYKYSYLTNKKIISKLKNINLLKRKKFLMYAFKSILSSMYIFLENIIIFLLIISIIGSFYYT